MSDFEMYVLPFLGIAMLAVGGMPLLWITTIAPKKRRDDAAGIPWFQFSLRSLLLWVVPIAAGVGWILSWEGTFFTKRSVLSQKAGALTLFALAIYLVLFVRWVRRMSRQARQAPQIESAE